MTDLHRIVVVEDDPDVAFMLRYSFERGGLSVRTAGSIGEARRVLHEEPWDVVVLDRLLPDGDGIELCAELRMARPYGYIMILTGETAQDEKVQGFALGADDYVTKPFNVDELLARVRAGLRIVELQKALLASNRRLQEISLTDELTQLRNRRAFDRELVVRFEAALRYARPLSVAAIDLDHFKRINDTFGHQTGDAVLQGVASILTASTRVTDFAARTGGEELSVILPETALFEAIHFGEKIRASIAAAPTSGHAVTVSVGVASLPHSKFASPSELLYAADQALYRAKFAGRNRVESEKRHERFARTEALPAARQRTQTVSL